MLKENMKDSLEQGNELPVERKTIDDSEQQFSRMIRNSFHSLVAAAGPAESHLDLISIP